MKNAPHTAIVSLRCSQNVTAHDKSTWMQKMKRWRGCSIRGETSYCDESVVQSKHFGLDAVEPHEGRKRVEERGEGCSDWDGGTKTERNGRRGRDRCSAGGWRAEEEGVVAVESDAKRCMVPGNMSREVRQSMVGEDELVEGWVTRQRRRLCRLRQKQGSLAKLLN